MTFIRMQDLELRDKRVLIREDLNVPIKNGQVGNDTRLRAAVPTIKLALEKGAKVCLMSHLGRPTEGMPAEQQSEFSLAPVAEYLAKLLGCSVALATIDTVGASSADVTLLENVRMNVGEGKNDDALAKRYAQLCDVFVMDAFGTAHRAQASTHGVAKFAATACAGLLLAGELDALAKSLHAPARPMLAIVGGAKVSSKLEVLKSLATKVDQLIVGGGIANTFLAASGVNVGKSLCEEELIPLAKELMAQTSIPLPVDVVVAKEFSAEAQATTKLIADIADDDLILDIGPQTAAQEFQIIVRERRRWLHFSADDQARYVLGLVGNTVLVGDQIEQIGAADRHEHALGKIEPEFLLEVVGCVFELGDAFANLGGFVPVPFDEIDPAPLNQVPRQALAVTRIVEID